MCHVQQLKYVNEDDLCSIGMTKNEAQRLKTFHNRYCPPNYVTKLKKLLLPTWSKDEFLLDDAEAESVPSPPSTTSNLSMPLPETVVQHQGKALYVDDFNIACHVRSKIMFCTIFKVKVEVT